MLFNLDEDGPTLPSKGSEEFRPFMRRLPEFKFWQAFIDFKGFFLQKSIVRNDTFFSLSQRMFYFHRRWINFLQNVGWRNVGSQPRHASRRVAGLIPEALVLLNAL